MKRVINEEFKKALSAFEKGNPNPFWKIEIARIKAHLKAVPLSTLVANELIYRVIVNDNIDVPEAYIQSLFENRLWIVLSHDLDEGNYDYTKLNSELLKEIVTTYRDLLEEVRIAFPDLYEEHKKEGLYYEDVVI